LIIDVVTHIASYNPIRICHDLPSDDPRPSLKYNHLIELLAFRFVHVHDHHTTFRLRVGREMLLNKCLADNL